MLDKFRFHNANWLEMVENQVVDEGTYGMDGMEDELPPYLSADLMQHTMLYQADHNPLDGLSDEEDDDADENNKPRSRYLTRRSRRPHKTDSVTNGKKGPRKINKSTSKYILVAFRNPD